MRGSLCFPKEGNFDTDRDLRSFVGNTDDAQLRLSSTQALAAALKRGDGTHISSKLHSFFKHLFQVAFTQLMLLCQ